MLRPATEQTGLNRSCTYEARRRNVPNVQRDNDSEAGNPAISRVFRKYGTAKYKTFKLKAHAIRQVLGFICIRRFSQKGVEI